MLKFLFANETNVVVSKAFFAKIVVQFENVLKTTISKILQKKEGEISLTLVNDKTIQKLNYEYREKNKPTDVLSFAYMEDFLSPNFKNSSKIQIGDIFISIDTAKKQAAEHKHELKKELEILFIHGLLHLFGFDHNDNKEEKEMEKWAKKTLKHFL